VTGGYEEVSRSYRETGMRTRLANRCFYMFIVQDVFVEVCKRRKHKPLLRCIADVVS